MLKTIALVVLLVILAVLVFAATRPNRFTVERSATMHAPPEKIFPLLQDFHQWGAWSPWERLDPNLHRTFSGSPSGKGAVYAWEGNSKVGAGRMEITDATPSTRIAIQLDFLKPFKASNVTLFSLHPEGDSTRVTWNMSGDANYMSKVMGLFMSMDKMVGKDFESGLANLKGIAER